jgi:hypothetical protein
LWIIDWALSLTDPPERVRATERGVPMKTLPENPSLDHVRQQAKELLTRRRATRPAMTLSEAQLELANEYGFRTWADLRAEIDRLRARTLVAEEVVASQIADVFDLGTVTGDMVAVERVWAGERWSLLTDRGLWVATELFGSTPVVEEVLEDEVRLVEAACSAGITAPLPVRTRDGDVLATIEQRRWRVHVAIRLGPAPVAITSDLAETAGHALGVLHRLALATDRSITAPPSAPIQARWLSSQPTEQQWRNLALRASESGVAWAPALDAVIPTLVDVASVCRDLSGEHVILSKHRLIPGDIRPGPDGSSVILNWEHPSPMPPTQELGASLAECEKNDHPVLLRAFLDGYRRAGRTVPELELAMFTTAISATLNWTATRISIALTSCDDERRDLAAREVPGLLANPPSRRRFERMIRALT